MKRMEEVERSRSTGSMTKSFILMFACLLSVACGARLESSAPEDARPIDPPVVVTEEPSQEVEPEVAPDTDVLFICAEPGAEEYLASALEWAVDSWAQTGAPVALAPCGEGVATLHNDTTAAPEPWARLLIAHWIGLLLGAEVTEQGIMRDWLLDDEARAFIDAFVCPDVSATSQIPGADHPCPLPEPGAQ